LFSRVSDSLSFVFAYPTEELVSRDTRGARQENRHTLFIKLSRLCAAKKRKKFGKNERVRSGRCKQVYTVGNTSMDAGAGTNKGPARRKALEVSEPIL